MILEIADIRIHPGKQREFEAAIQQGLDSVLSKSPGYRAHQVHRGIESPERYVLMVYWQTLDSHTVGFRESPRFVEWRAIVGPFFAEPPRVEHFSLLAASS